MSVLHQTVIAPVLKPPASPGIAAAFSNPSHPITRDGQARRPALNRRRFVASVGLGLTALATMPPRAFAEATRVPISEAFDREVEAFMAARKIPGGAVAVAKDARLVYAKGYGWANREQQVPATADTLFRIASISKPVTAAAVLRLIEDGELDLDARAFERLLLQPPRGRKSDPRLAHATIRQLLQHTGGWDRDKSFDPMFRSREIARSLDVSPPAGAQEIIRYMLGQKLDFNPGTRYAYSNFGYCVLGRLIEKISGVPYELFVREKILQPAGLAGMRLGKTLEDQQAPNESRYYTSGRATARSVFTNTPRDVPWPYGGFCLEAMDAHGGWLASAVELVRFAAVFDNATPTPLFRAETLRLMQSPPPPPVSRKDDGSLADSYYGLGWAVRPVGAGGKVSCWHTGSLPGTSSLLVRRHDGLSWAVVFNQRSEDKNLPDSAIDGALHRAANSVAEWPAHNLFDTRRSPP